MNKLKICVAGATGWAGSALCRGIFEAVDMELVAAVSRSHAGKTMQEAIGLQGLNAPIFGTVEEALTTRPDVFVEYTKPGVARSHVISALKSGAHVVIGTSGLGSEDYDEIDTVAKSAGLGVLAAGNFALTAVLLQKFAEMAARYIPDWEIIDYAHAGKKDAPSGTARELADRLSRIREAALEVPLDKVEGYKESSRCPPARDAGPLRPLARLYDLSGCDLRHARPEADLAARVRLQRRALRGRSALSHSRSRQTGRPSPGA